MTTKESEIIEKIEKLLRLSQSSNVNEAMVAMKKARTLMLKYHIDEMRVNPNAEKEETVYTEEHKIKFTWEAFIYAVLCKNMRCTIYLRRGKENTLIIIGYKSDTEAVKVMGSFLVDVCKAGLREERQNVSKNKYSTHGLANIYRSGFIDGVNTAFREQNTNTEYALMIITPPKVKAEDQVYRQKHTMGAPTKYGQINPSDARAYRDSYTKGYNKGYEFGGKKQISQ